MSEVRRIKGVLRESLGDYNYFAIIAFRSGDRRYKGWWIVISKQFQGKIETFHFCHYFKNEIPNFESLCNHNAPIANLPVLSKFGNINNQNNWNVYSVT